MFSNLCCRLQCCQRYLRRNIIFPSLLWMKGGRNSFWSVFWQGQKKHSFLLLQVLTFYTRMLPNPAVLSGNSQSWFLFIQCFELWRKWWNSFLKFIEKVCGKWMQSIPKKTPKSEFFICLMYCPFKPEF